MRRLSGADSLFIFNETPARHQHTLKVAVVDPTDADAEVTYEALRDQISEALPILEPYRWRLARVPFDLGHPYWLESTDLDLGYHVRHLACAAPGGPQELSEVISQIASVGLSRDHPLWQIWFVDGLSNGCVAYVAKMHHALADGLASKRLLEETFATEPGHTPMGDHGSLPAEPSPGRPRLLALALTDIARMIWRLPTLLWRTAQGARRNRARVRAGGDPGVGPFRGPHTRFDAPITAARQLAYETFDLAAMKTVGRAFGATVTHVMLAMSAGALRRYLDQHDELPAASLTATVPVSVRRPDEERTWGNRVASWYLSLATDVDDPVARLHTIVRGARAARGELDAMGPELQHDWAEYWRLFRFATFGVPHAARRFIDRPSYNAIVSTVTGPTAPIYRHGARLVKMISMGPLVEGIGINFTGWSYAGEVTIAVMACREQAPDIWELAAGLRASLDELVAAAAATDATKR